MAHPLLALTFATLAWAQDPVEPAPPPLEGVNPFREADESALFRLDEQLVTVASRYAQTARKAPSIVTVVTADQIRERGYRTVSDLLRALPGIYVWKSVEGRDLVAVRGVISSDNNKILVLVDGQPWYDGVYTHGFVDDYLPISNIQQVEVIKGPGSAIYGTNAFTGVVNIVTWDAGKLEGARVRWLAGSSGRSDLTATGGGRAQVGGSLASVTTYARVLSQVGDGVDVTTRGRSDVLGHDPKRAVNLGARLEVEGLRIGLHHVDYQHTFLRQEVDDPIDAASKSLDTFSLGFRDTFVDARWAVRLGEGTTLTPHAWAQHHDNPSNYAYDLGSTTVEVAPGEFVTESGLVTVEAEKTTNRWGGGLDLQARPGIDHVLVAGAGLEAVDVLALYDAEYAGGSHDPAPTGFAAVDDCGQAAGFPGDREGCGVPSLRNLFAYAQYTWTALPVLELTAGARVDKRVPSNAGERGDDGVFATSVSPRLGVLLVPSDRVTAKLLYGRAFRAPAVRELLVRAEPDEDGSYEFSNGNLELVPESIHTTEAELAAALLDDLEVRLDGSYSRLVDEIDKVNPPNQYCNLPGSLDVAGAEVGVDASPGPVRLGAGYSLTLARYVGDERLDEATCPGALPATSYAGLGQYEFPPHMGKLDLGWAFSDTLSTTLLAEVYGERPRREWAVRGIDDGSPFALLHLSGRAAGLGRQDNVGLGFAVRNLLDAAWSTGIYREDAAEEDDGAPKYPLPVEGEGRSVTAWLELTW